MSKPRSILQRFRHFLLTTILGGIVVILPIAIFLFLLDLIFSFISNILGPIKQLFDFPFELTDWIIDLLAFGLVMVAFFFIGLFVRTNFGNRLFGRFEKNILEPLPFYTVLREMVQSFFGNKNQMPFTQVVSVDVFNNPTRMLGFISDETPDGRFTIFVPTGPNPTNGFIFVVQESQIRRLDIRPEEAMRIIIGVGTGARRFFENDPIDAPIGSTPEKSPGSN